MFVEKKLRKLQDNIRNKGWRIQHIPWLPEGKVETYTPKNASTWLFIISGLLCFLGGPVLLSKLSFPVWGVIAVMLLGLALLFCSRYAAGFFLYGHFVPVEAVCIDREFQEFVHPDSMDSLTENTFWQPRILCAFQFEDKTYKVTPIIVKTVAFKSKEGVQRFLDKRINEKGKCILWIDPNYPRHTVFHKKPITGPYTV
jgi:hypothetical protein